MKCKHCNGPMTFEFQLHSTIQNLTEELYGADWGIIAIYTCHNSCIDENNFTEEVVMLQLNDEAELDYETLAKGKKNQENKLEEMVNKEEKKKKNKKNKKKEEDII